MDIKEMSSWGISDIIYNIVENGFHMDEETGEIYFTEDDLDALEMALDDKLNSICGIIKSYESKYKALKERKTEIDATMKSYEKHAEKLKDYLKVLMDSHGIKSKDLKDYRLGMRKSSSVNIDDEDKVYDYMDSFPKVASKCVKIETKKSLIKTELKKALEDDTIPGVSIVENRSISIK